MRSRELDGCPHEPDTVMKNKYPPAEPVDLKLWTAQSGILNRFTDHHSVVAYLESPQKVT
jgi:hypothetical protein